MMLRKEFQGLLLDLFIKPEPEVGNDPLTDEIHQIGLNITAHSLDDVNQDNPQGDPLEHLCVLFEEDVIQGGLDQEGQRRGHGADDEHAEHRQGKPRKVGLGQFQKTLEDIHCFPSSIPACSRSFPEHPPTGFGKRGDFADFNSLSAHRAGIFGRLSDGCHRPPAPWRSRRHTFPSGPEREPRPSPVRGHRRSSRARQAARWSAPGLPSFSRIRESSSRMALRRSASPRITRTSAAIRSGLASC